MVICRHILMKGRQERLNTWYNNRCRTIACLSQLGATSTAHMSQLGPSLLRIPILAAHTLERSVSCSDSALLYIIGAEPARDAILWLDRFCKQCARKGSPHHGHEESLSNKPIHVAKSWNLAAEWGLVYVAKKRVRLCLVPPHRQDDNTRQAAKRQALLLQ